MLDSVLVVEDGAASESKSGNIVLKSAVDEKEEDAKGSHRNQSLGTLRITYCYHYRMKKRK